MLKKEEIIEMVEDRLRKGSGLGEPTIKAIAEAIAEAVTTKKGAKGSKKGDE